MCQVSLKKTVTGWWWCSDCSPMSQVLQCVAGVSEEECDWMVMLLLD